MNEALLNLKREVDGLYHLAVVILGSRYDEILELITHELGIIKMLPLDNEEVVLREIRNSSKIITALASQYSTQYSHFFVVKYNKLVDELLNSDKLEPVKEDGWYKVEQSSDGVSVTPSFESMSNNRGGDRKPKKVLQYNKSGRFVKEWASMTEAARSGEFNQSTISLSCKTGKPHRNFYWRYRKSGLIPKHITI